MHDFSRCKLCQSDTAAPRFPLSKTTVYACNRCDFHFIDQLDDMTGMIAERPLTRKELDFIDERLNAAAGNYRRQLALARHCLPLAGARCLDLGAGAGGFAALLAEAGADVQAIEPQPLFRTFARDRHALTFRPETVDHPFWQEQAETFDLVTLWDVLEHVNFPVATLAGAARLLKPGGWLLLDTPRRDALVYRFGEWTCRNGGTGSRLLETFYSPLPFRHKQIFTRQQLRWLTEELGLSVVQLHSNWTTLHGQMTLVARKRGDCPD